MADAGWDTKTRAAPRLNLDRTACIAPCIRQTPLRGRAWERLRVEFRGLPPFEATVSSVGEGGQRGLAFRLSAAEQRLLVRRIFCTTDYIVPDEIGDAGLTILAVAKTAFR